MIETVYSFKETNEKAVEKIVDDENMVNIPCNVKMNVTNQNEEVLEFFVVKSPSPQNYVVD